MDIRKKEWGLRALNCENFSVKDTLTCGQVFRFIKTNDGEYRVLSKNKQAILKEEDNAVNIITDAPEYFYNYFDLDRDYKKIISDLSAFPELHTAIEFGKGIRILNQDLFETIISFIISANNNIPRIKGIIERMCAYCGEELSLGEHAFPSLESLTNVGEEKFREFGAGFRAPYLAFTAKKISDTDFLSEIISFRDKTSGDSERCDGLLKRLLSLKGVGQKVADCVLLFGLRESASFPTDTWVFQSARTAELDTVEKVRRFYSQRYGKLSGYAQQYLFYYERSKKLIKEN